jgi:dUTP pyrophosphatase
MLVYYYTRFVHFITNFKLITSFKLIDIIYYILNKNTTFKVKLIHPDASVPSKADPGCAGYDLSCSEKVVIQPRTRKLVCTGITAEIDPHFYLRVAPRSGLSVQGIDIGAGVIDSSYRGEIKVLMINNNVVDHTFIPGSRIAQLILERCSDARIEVSDLNQTTRGDSGFGSTGI